MEATKIVITGKPLVDLDSIRELLDGVVEDAINRSFAPAGRLIDPEKADQVVKDSVDRGAPTRETATGYAIAAMRMAELPPDTIQQVVAEMRVMIDKYSPAEAAQIATSSPY